MSTAANECVTQLLFILKTGGLVLSLLDLIWKKLCFRKLLDFCNGNTNSHNFHLLA